MGRGKKIGVVLILAGFCIPILATLFASGYRTGQDLIWNVQNTEVVIWTERVPITSEQDGPWKKYQAEIPGWIPAQKYQTLRYAIPCSALFGLGIILTATGIGLVVCSPKR